MPLAFWFDTYSLEFLLNIKVFVGVAVQRKLATKISSIFLKCYSLFVGSLKIVVQDGVNYLLVVHRRKRLRITALQS